MIIEFSVENFRSIKTLQTISFIAAPVKSKDPKIDDENIFAVNEKLSLLKSIGLYGANSSGKSNFVKAMIQMLFIVKDVMSDERVLEKYIEPFELDQSSNSKPTFFQLQFLIGDKIYRYGFEATSKEIVSEWLYGIAEKTETFYFERTDGKIKVNSKYFPEGKGLGKLAKKTNLFLNVVNALNGKLSAEIKDFLQDSIAISLGVSDEGFKFFSSELLKDDNDKSKLINFLNQADIDIKDISTDDEENPDEDDRNITHAADAKRHVKIRRQIIGQRSIVDDDRSELGTLSYNFDRHESEGTKKLFSYSGALILALRHGKVLVMDEFDARLHPIITKQILSMFNSSEINRFGAQLLFITHDTNLLNNEILRRDQVYFAEKDSLGATNYYSLYDIKGVRNDATYEKDYIKGKYGAIPFLGEFNELIHE